MYEDTTYCCNHECKNKYKCEIYVNEEYNGKEVWFTIYDQEDCPYSEQR